MKAAKIGIKAKCIKDDGANAYYGILDELRWRIGDELIVTDIYITPYGTFLHNHKGQNINTKRCELVDANIQENLKFVSFLSLDTQEARRLKGIYSQFVGDFDENERAELWVWLKKKGRENEFEAIS